MTSKRPTPLLEMTTKKSKSSIPKLSKKAQLTLLSFLKYHSQKKFGINEETIDDLLPNHNNRICPGRFKESKEYKYRHLIVSKRFLNSFFDACGKSKDADNFGLDSQNIIIMNFYYEEQRFFVKLGNISSIRAFLRLAIIPKTNFYLNDSYNEWSCKGGLTKWIEIVNLLKENKQMVEFSIICQNVNHPLSRVLIEILPHKIKNAIVWNANLNFMVRPKLEMDTLRIASEKWNLDLTKMLEIKVKEIIIEANVSLLDLAKCEKLKSNRFIEKLQIGAPFLLERNKTNEQNDLTWETEIFPKFKTALNVLKNINPTIEVILYESQRIKDYGMDLNSISSDLTEQIENAKRVIDLFQSNEQIIKKIELHGEFKFDESLWSEKIIEEIADNLGLFSLGESMICDTIQYSGVDIEIDKRYEFY